MRDYSFGWPACGGKPSCGCAQLVTEEIDEEFRNASRFFVLEPVGGVGEGVEFGGVAVAEAVVGHGGEEEGVALAPEDAREDMDSRIRKFAAMAKGGAVPVYHGG